MIGLIIVVVWKLIAIVVSAVIASNRDRSEILWAFLGVFFDWIAILIVACLPKSIGLAAERESKTDSLDDLKKLQELFDSGSITQEEFDAKKKQILKL